MKQRIYLIVFTLFIQASILGQNFVSSDNQWNARLSGPGGITTEIFMIDGDSVVDSIMYKKIWASWDSLAHYSFQGLLREESNIVYYIPPSTSEGILYDFNLEIGDSAFVRNIFCGDQDVLIHIINIDTVEYFGTPRKRWHLGENGNIEEYWLEGIGSLNGPLYTKYWDCIVCPIWELLCFHNNDTLEYILPGETECFQTSVGIIDNNVQEGFDFKIIPNPVNKQTDFHIETNTKIVMIDIFNSIGQLVKTLYTENSYNRIKAYNFESGLYFITITTNDNITKTKKLIIK